MTPEELQQFKRLLAKYLAMECVYCQSATFEDRHILTCVTCGVVLSDLREVVTTDEQ